MNTFFAKLKSLWSVALSHKIISVIILIVVIGGGYEWYHQAHASAGTIQYITQPAATTTITVAVTGTGQVSAQNTINLKPGNSGSGSAEITSVNVKQGDEVKAGQILAEVDERSNEVALSEAEASLSQAQANYNSLLAGATNTDLESAQLQLDEANQALQKAQTNATQTATDQQQAVAKAQNNLLNSGLQLTPSNNLTSASVTLSGTYTGTAQGSYNISTYQTANGIYYNSTGLGSANSLINRGLSQPLGNGLSITFSATGTIDPSTVWTIAVPNTDSSDYTSNQFALQSAQQTQTEQLQSAQQAITSAQDGVQSAQINMQTKTQPPTDAQVTQAKAQILAAQSQLATAQVNYDNNIIKSPFDGQVAQLNNQVGDQVTTSSIIAVVITNEKLAQISLNENDAAKVQIGQKVNLTFDALSGINIAGSVAEVDNIGTVSQGVVTYNVKIAFDSQNDQIKSGMSVTANIITNAKTDVLAVPSSAVKTNAGGSYVQILVNGAPQNKTVTTGISNNTETEIDSGLTAGQEVITQTISAKTSSTTTRTTTTGIPGLGGNAGFGGGAGTVRFTTGGGGFGGGAAAAGR